ncbi:anti-sigma factor domain-containing protein [Aerococcaceae bacterium DSM 111176]|nr:anti-sigma factor domain-containing protein [Aerococcaceae bacterium DSM 111176]
MTQFKYYKALVVELHEQYAIVMNEGGSITRIKVKGDMKLGDSIYYLEEDIYIKPKANNVTQLSRNRQDKSWVRPLLMAALLFLVVWGGVQYFVPSQEIYAAISVGIDEGQQIELDESGEITAVRDASGNLMTNHEWIGLSVTDITDEILAFVSTSSNPDTAIGFYSDNGEWLMSMDSLVERLVTDQDSTNLIVLRGGMEEYASSIGANQSANQNHLATQNVNLWQTEQSDTLPASHKEQGIGDAGEYYQVRPEPQSEIFDYWLNFARFYPWQAYYRIANAEPRIEEPPIESYESIIPDDDWDDDDWDDDDWDDDDWDDDDWDDDDWDDDDWDDDDWDDDDWDDDDWDDDDWDDDDWDD